MKLSVCIPVYNVAPYIETCARSLLGQTYRDIEFIFVDDATPDDSIAIVERVMRDFPDRAHQVKILHHEKNRGLIAARKTAIRAATGELITHCDSDDWVDIDLYEKMVARLDEAGADVVLCSTRRYLGERVLVAKCPRGLAVSGSEALRRMDALPALNAMMTKVMRRERIDLDGLEYPESLVIAEDYCFMVQALPNFRKLVTAPDAFYNYRINANSMTRSRNVRRLVDHHVRVYDILTRCVPPGDVSAVPRRNLVRAILFWGTVCGLLSSDDFRRWKARYAELGGCWDWSDKSLWGQRMMKLADRSYALACLIVPFVKGRIHDYL